MSHEQRRQEQPDDSIPELSVHAFASILKNSTKQILVEVNVLGKQYAHRFFAPPYEASAASILVYGHGRDRNLLSPLVIRRVLTKFGIEETEFWEVYRAQAF